jgi:hypothetical protein
MTTLKLALTNNTMKGPFKPPKYRCSGLDNGVPFTRCYRTLQSVRKLKRQSQISNFEYVILN